MALKDEFSDDLDNVFLNTDEFAEKIVYEGNSVDAIVDRLEDVAIDGNNAGQEARIIIKKGVIDSIKPGDSVTIGSDSWRVERVLESYTNLFKIFVRRKQAVSFNV